MVQRLKGNSAPSNPRSLCVCLKQPKDTTKLCFGPSSSFSFKDRFSCALEISSLFSFFLFMRWAEIESEEADRKYLWVLN